jgi:AcrR family transcriptional regulator
MSRPGLTPVRVVEEAELLADEVGLANLTLAGVASRLGVRLPSLYKHVAGLDAVASSMVVRAKQELVGVLARSAAGRSGDAAVAAMCRAYLDWGRRHPGRYALTIRAPDPQNPADCQVDADLLALVFDVLAAYALQGSDAVDAIRALRAAVHGFLELEHAGGFGQPEDVDRSFDRMIEGLSKLLASWRSDADAPAPSM